VPKTSDAGGFGTGIPTFPATIAGNVGIAVVGRRSFRRFRQPHTVNVTNPLAPHADCDVDPPIAPET